VYRASRDDDVVFRRELDAIAAARGSRVHYLLGSRRQLGYVPLAAERLLQLVPDLAERDVYLCGPPGMTAAARAQLRRAGVRRRAIHTESFEF
jgi:ferredoxin-NADP reductase